MSQTLLEGPTTPTEAGEVKAPDEPLYDAAPHKESAVDQLAVGMAFLLVMTVVQRGVGLVRNVLFCRILGPEDLGRWNLAFSFLVLAAPLAVLGLPGSFGRYAEYFRQCGRLRTFLRRTAAATAMLALAASGLVVLLPEALSPVIFRDESHVRLTILIGLTLAAVIAFNAMTELFTALRRVRVASMMHFVQSLSFTTVALALLMTAGRNADAVVAAYGAACLAACLGASFWLRETWRGAPSAATPLSHAEFWSKLLPFAAWVWLTNLLTNLSGVADRYLILHFADADAATASALVGQYHSSRVAPDLLASVAMMLAAAILPYNSHDWEAGDRRAVSLRVNLAIKLTGLTFTAAGVLLLLAAPLLFGWALDGKYEIGESLQPWTLVLCIWLSLAVLGQSYLWCAERAGLATFSIGVGLAANAVLIVVLMPRLGLTGAAVAAALANGVTLIMTLWIARRLNMKTDGGTLVACLAPWTLVLGVVPAAAVIGTIGVAALRSERIFSAEEKQKIWASLGMFATKRKPTPT